MKLVRGGMNSPLYTSWSTPVNFGATGIVITQSGLMQLTLPTNVYTLRPYVEWDVSKVSGTGFVRSWIYGLGYGPHHDNLGDNVAQSNYYSGHMSYTELVRTDSRAWMGSDQWIIPYGVGTASNYRFYIRAVGSELDTEWTVTNIKGRILYVPL